MNYLLYFGDIFKGSLLSSGGLGNLPSIRDDFLTKHWATDHEIAESLTIGQITPGPNGLWVICLGYLTAGVSGSILALIGIVIPPLMVIGIERIYRRIHRHPAVEGFVQGLTLAVSAVFLIVLSLLLKADGVTVKSSAIAAAAAGLLLTKKVPIPAILAIAALAGIVT